MLRLGCGMEHQDRDSFSTIDQKWLEDHVVIDTKLLHRWLQAGYYEGHRLFPTKKGAAQGGPLSPALANGTLDGLERLLAQHFPARPVPYPQVYLIRYADDFLISGRDRSLLETKVKPLVEAFLQERGLTLSLEKTVITHISNGVDFLGQHLQTYRGRLLVTPSTKNVQAFLEKVRTVIRKHRQSTAGDVIEHLNPVLRGWAFFHRHVASSRTYARVDHVIFTMLWAWARRRHPTKGTDWVRKRYFQTVGNRHWVFSGTVPDTDGTPVTLRLFATATCHYRRHIQVKATANPYDPAWRAYFARRHVRRTPSTATGATPPGHESPES